MIITYYWPPAGGSGVQRWLKFVKYLRDFGIEPVVYTVKDPNYAIEDITLEMDVPKEIEILKQPIWEPNNFLTVLGGKKKKVSAGFLNSNPSFFGKILQYIRANYFIPDARKFWIKPSVSYLKKYLENHQIDAVISTGPPHSTHLIGLALKKQMGIKWVADFRDPWTEIDYFHQLPLTKTAIEKHHKLEQEVLQYADLTIVVGKTMATNFKKYSNHVEVITNGYDTTKNSDTIELDTKFSLVHVGLMNADRNHQILWEVLKELSIENPNFKKDLQLKFIGKLADEVVTMIHKYQLVESSEIIDYVPHHQVLSYQKSAQVLLLAVNNVPSAKGIITGKIFEYLQANRPILAIAPTDGDLNEIINSTNSGVVVDFHDKEKLKIVLSNLYLDFKNKKLKCSSKNIEQYHRRELTKELAKILKNSLVIN